LNYLSIESNFIEIMPPPMAKEKAGVVYVTEFHHASYEVIGTMME
jgi:hypothetical protein